MGDRLRAQGRRMTPQRARVLAALTHLGHATPEDVVEVVAANDSAPWRRPPSTARWRPWSRLGVVAHTHLDHKAPSYHLAEHADHIHLVCRSCGTVREFPKSLAERVRGECSARPGALLLM